MRAKLTAALMVLGTAGLWSAAQSGCAGSGTTPAPVVSSSSGAFGVVTVNGKQLMFLPLKELTDGGDGQIAVVDVGLPGTGKDGGTPAQVTVIDMLDGGVPTATAGDATVIVAAGTETYTVWFIDPATQKITDSIALPPNLNSTSFSTDTPVLVSGIAIDEANHRAILSVWNGIIFVDLGSHAITGSVLAAAAENFGYDSTLQYVLLPYYGCGIVDSPGNGDTDGGYATLPPCNNYVTLGDAGVVITNGLNLVDLKKTPPQVYTFELADAGNEIPLGADPDSAAVDPATGLAMVPSERSYFYTFIDLSKAKFSSVGDAGFFTAPSVLDYNQASTFDTGVAIEPASHLAFTEQEYSQHVSVLDLTKINTSTTGFGPGVSADGDIPNPPSGEIWQNLGDPHGIAVTTGIQSGDPVGFVVSDPNDGSGGIWVARVDLNKMLQLGLSQTGVPLTTDQMLPAVTFLDATRKE